MVDGVMLLVDSSEGPLPQTRFVLSKALEAGLPADRGDQQDRPQVTPAPTPCSTRSTTSSSTSTRPTIQLEFPVLYTNAREGKCRLDARRRGQPILIPLFEPSSSTIPPPTYEDAAPLQFLVTTLDYDDYLGAPGDRPGRSTASSATGRSSLRLCKVDGSERQRRSCLGIFGYDGLKRVRQVDAAGPGDIVAVITGLDDGHRDRRDDLPTREPEPLCPTIQVDEPTIAMVVSGSTTRPSAGREGKHVTSRKLRERLDKEVLDQRTSIRVEETELGRDRFQVSWPR